MNASWLAKPQPRLGVVGLTALLIVLNAMTPFSIDIYTPAVPSMPAEFGTSEAMVNFTISGFVMAFSVGMLVFGVVSDRLGRKPVLIGGTLAYCAGSLACAAAGTVEMLIAARVIQALGAGACSAVSTALVKDCLVEEHRGAMYALLQIMMIVGPVVAPLLGALILSVGTWHEVFVALAVVGLVCFVFVLFLREPIGPDERERGGVLATFAGLASVLRVKQFMLVCLCMGLFTAGFNAYISVGSYVYIDFFGCTKLEYSCFFAAASAASALGPIVFVALGRRMSGRVLGYLGLGLAFAAGVLFLVVGRSGAWAFFVCILLFVFASSGTRPLMTNLAMGLYPNAGAASSMLNFLVSILGFVGMLLINLPFSSYVAGLAVIVIVAIAFGTLAWRAASGTDGGDKR